MSTSETPGLMLRRLRTQRGLTLRSAAARLLVSASALSRLEHDARAVGRHDIEMVVRGYILTQWEASQLLQCAGFTAELPETLEGQVDWTFVTRLLRSIHFPAHLDDDFGFIIAWNGPMHALWRMPAKPAGPIHVLDGLFSVRGRQHLGDHWREVAVEACWRFYMKTMRISGGPRFHTVMQNLARVYGSDFDSVWHEALTNGYSASSLARLTTGTLFKLQTQEGDVDYLALQTVVHSPFPLELSVQVPLGEPSIERHRLLLASVDLSRVVRCPRGPDTLRATRATPE